RPRPVDVAVAPMADPFKTDLRLIFPRPDQPDLSLGAGISETVSGVDNLAQALTLRLLVDRGELAALGHPRYGTRIRELLGETLDRANLELLRRYVRLSLLADPRVQEVASVDVTPNSALPGAVDVLAIVVAANGATFPIQVALDGG